VADLEDNHSRTTSTVTTIQTAVAALTIAVAAAERSADNKKPLEQLERKIGQDMSAVSREVSQVKSNLQTVERNTNAVVARITTLEGRLPPPAPVTSAQRK
jgi:chromosome segregation ATPase